MSRLALALAALAAVAISSCGGGSREEFVQGANKACALVSERLELFGQSPEDRDELLQQIAGVDQALDDGVEDLEALETPGGEDGERAEQLVEALSDEAQTIKPILEQLDQAVRDDDAQALNEARQRLEEVDEREADRLARELGADRCLE